MLRRAQAKVDKRGLSHVKSLQVMDVTHLTFPDGMFDAVTAQFIITLVPEPEKALDQFARVLKPGGEIILANHFGQPGRSGSCSRGVRIAGREGDRLEFRLQGIAGRGMGKGNRVHGSGGIEVAISGRLFQIDADPQETLS